MYDCACACMSPKGSGEAAVARPPGASSCSRRIVTSPAWWCRCAPFAPGPLPNIDTSSSADGLVTHVRPDAVLDSLAPLDVQIGQSPLAEMLLPAYEHIASTYIEAPA